MVEWIMQNRTEIARVALTLILGTIGALVIAGLAAAAVGGLTWLLYLLLGELLFEACAYIVGVALLIALVGLIWHLGRPFAERIVR